MWTAACGGRNGNVAARGRWSVGNRFTGVLGTLACAAAFLGMLTSKKVSAQNGVIDREAEIKAAYLYNFGKYVDWPAEIDTAIGDSSVFVIGVVGEHAALQPLHDLAAAKELNGRKIVIRRVMGPEDYRPCHLMFFSADAPASLTAHILEAVKESPTLTVGERAGFAHTGGMVNLYLEQNRVKFEINHAAALQSRLTISSKLLSIGKIVSP